MTQHVNAGDDRAALIEEIRRLKKEKGAVVLAHYYTDGDVQDLADIIGDSLALARKAAELGPEVSIVVMCGVHFMGETVKVLCPDKTVLMPDLSAGCSLADSCPVEDFRAFIEAHPGHTVISYVNTSLGVKALSDVLVTSGNALKVVESFPKDEKIIFGPDRNLGAFINSATGREMVLWDGACHVHERFSVEGIKALKAEHPEAPVLVHPECKRPVVLLADKVGSTAALLEFARASEAREFIVATESGILHEMRKACPEKTFLPAPPSVGEAGEGAPGCGCNDCAYMKLNTLRALRDCLRDGRPEIKVDPALAREALRSIDRMLELS